MKKGFFVNKLYAFCCYPKKMEVEGQLRELWTVVCGQLANLQISAPHEK
jgi:hypothetical protein